MKKNTKTFIVLLLTTILSAGSVLMIGPQIVGIVLLAVVAGIIFAIRRSFLSLVCIGYPLTFGLVSALIGATEIDGYERTTAFAISVFIGLTGVGLTVTGFWKALPTGTVGATDGDQGTEGQPPARHESSA
jgi:hypothetical protein